MAVNATQVAVISGWNDLYESMGPGGHVRRLDWVMGAMTGAQRVQNDPLLVRQHAWVA